MINNPGAFPGHASLLPSAQQAPAAELDNGDTCEGAFRGLHRQHPPTFLYSPDQDYFCGFCFHLGLLLTLRKSQSVAMTASLSLPARVSQKVGSDPSSLYFKVLPQWVIFYFSPFMESAERVGVLEASDSKIQLDVSRTQIPVP